MCLLEWVLQARAAGSLPGQAEGILLLVLTPDHLRSPGDGGNPVVPSVRVAFRQNHEKKELLRNGFCWAAHGQGLHRDGSVSCFSPVWAWGGCSCRLFVLFHQRCGAMGNIDCSQLLYQQRARKLRIQKDLFLLRKFGVCLFLEK